MKKTKTAIQFSGLLLLLLGLLFFVHLLVLHFVSFPLFENKITWAYSINYVLAVLIFITLTFLKDKVPDSLGFIFLGGSLLKFIAFFLVFNPSYKLDGGTSPVEFTSFFIPYAFCLIIEVIFLIKLLKD